MKDVHVEAADLPLKKPFKISRNVVSVSRSYFIKCADAAGEAAPVRFYGEIEATTEAALCYLLDRLEVPSDPRPAWRVLDKALGYNYGAKCGIDLMLWDRYGKMEGATVRGLLGIKTSAPVHTAQSIGIDTPELMQAEVRHNPGFRVYKLKVGFDGDIDAVAAVREVTQMPLYVDANGGWTVEEACRRLPELRKLGVVVCEQPIFSGLRRDWERVRDAARMTVIVDEYCRRPDDVAHWTGWVDGVNVKLQKAGGISPAYEMIRRAREEGMKVMIGCMLESSVGIAAAAQLAPLADFVDLDSHLMLTHDPYDGVPCADGALLPSERPGLGVWPRS
jgi:L-alanine-DL-glutamate epimerase-like enolase superfamily enzyme